MKALKQSDPRWKNIKLGTCSVTIGSHGCLITSYAMLADVYPDFVNHRLKANKGYSNGCYVLNDVAARLLGLDFSWERDRPLKYPCIAETAHYAPKVPQHFFVMLDSKTMIDPITGKQGRLKYKIKSYRNATPKPKEPQMTKEQEAVIANLKKEDVWPFHKAGTTSKNLLFIFNRDVVDSFGGTKKFNEAVLKIKDNLREIVLLKATNLNLGNKFNEMGKEIDRLEKEINKLVDNKKGDIMTKGFDWSGEWKVLIYLILTGIITTIVAWIAGLDLASQPAWIVGIFTIVNLILKGIKDKYLPKS